MPSEKQIEALDRFTEAVIDYVDKKLVKNILSDMSFMGNLAPSRKLVNNHGSFFGFSPLLPKGLAKK